KTRAACPNYSSRTSVTVVFSVTTLFFSVATCGCTTTTSGFAGLSSSSVIMILSPILLSRWNEGALLGGLADRHRLGRAAALVIVPHEKADDTDRQQHGAQDKAQQDVTATA